MNRILILITIALVLGWINSKKIHDLNPPKKIDLIDLEELPEIYFMRYTGETAQNKLVYVYVTRNFNPKNDSFFENGRDYVQITISHPDFGEIIESSGNIDESGTFNVESDDYYDGEPLAITGKFLGSTKLELSFKTDNLVVNSLILHQNKGPLSLKPLHLFYKKPFTPEDGELMLDFCVSEGTSFTYKMFSDQSKIVPIVSSYLDSLQLWYTQKISKAAFGKSSMWYEFADLEVYYYSDDFLSISKMEGHSECGAAHGMYGIEFYNFDLKTNSEILLTDILTNLNKSSLERLAETHLLDKHPESVGFYEKFYLSEIFAISQNGLVFQYQPYEVGPYSSGAIKILISYDELLPYMKSSDLTRRLRNQKML